MNASVDFHNIVGQEQVITGLSNAIKHNRIGHAYILSGPKGIGKRTVARAFADILLCNNQDSLTKCGQCMSCRMLAGGSNPDFHIIEPEGASIGVDVIRNMQGDIIIRPVYSKYKVYIINDADKMTIQAQNCLLKTLEEPPGYAVIILTTSNYDALIDTIRSRALRYNFKKNSYAEVQRLLEQKYGQDLDNIGFLASYADGIIGTALELAHSDEFSLIRENAIETLLKLTDKKLLDIFDLYSFFETNKNNIDNILDIMLLFYRDLLVAKKAGKENILINSDKKDIILKNMSIYTVHKLVKNIEVIEAARRNIKQNANYQLTIEVMLMKLQEECS